MKKTVIFHFSYKGYKNLGNSTEKMTYSIFKSKNAIIHDLFYWVKLKSEEINKSCNEECTITNIQIIGL
jgi:hypothetical protein